MKNLKKILSVVISVLLIATCLYLKFAPASSDDPNTSTTPTSQTDNGDDEEIITIEEDGYYYDKDNVALYIYIYNKLPENYVTKSEAQNAGWSGGSVEKYIEDAAIGGDTFGNKEGLLPEASGRTYYECDIDTHGASERGAKRIIFSNDGLIYYTEDHYESFTQAIIEEDADGNLYIEWQ